jgi:hypothetical protein
MSYLQLSSSLLFGILGFSQKSKSFSKFSLVSVNPNDNKKIVNHNLNDVIANLKGTSITNQAFNSMGEVPSVWKKRAIAIHDMSISKAFKLTFDNDPTLRITGYMALYYQRFEDLDKVEQRLIQDDATVSIQSGRLQGQDTVSNIISEIGQWIYAPAINEYYCEWVKNGKINE